MRCPICNSDNNGVVDTRSFDTVIIRQRKCRSCKHTFRSKEELSQKIEIFEDGYYVKDDPRFKEYLPEGLDPLKSQNEMIIYFIKSSNGLIKIGITSDIETRFENLKTMSPCMISLVKCIPGTIETERKIHKKFKHLRQHGEWFLESDELLAFIKQIVDKIHI